MKMHMSRSRSIGRRLMVNNLSVVGAAMLAVVVILSIITWSTTYGRIQQRLEGRSEEVVSLFAEPSEYSTPEDFNAVTSVYVQFFADKDDMEMMNISTSGQILITSAGFIPSGEQEMPDYYDAIISADGKGYWVGRLQNGEKVMAVTREVLNAEGHFVGAVRYMVSLTRTDQVITLYILLYSCLAVTVVAIVTLMGSFMVKSIVDPISGVNTAAKRIAGGDFEARLVKTRDDEMGQLIDTINEMAAELGTNEKLKNEFISSVSHELRTPLTSIEGWAETLQNGDVDNETKNKGMAIIMKETQRLTGLVEELLDFSRLQNGRFTMNMGKVDILTELDEVVFLVSDRIENEGKILDYDTPTALPAVSGDPNRLRQVFVNVVDNAIKYTSEGGRIRVSAESDNVYVQIMVEDTGCGIPEEEIENVRKKFYKANQQVRGSGIGLAIVDEIVAMHNGLLDIESKLGVGTKVTISLPISS